MAKRGPQSDLTDRNWDQEDEPEEAGVFKKAADEIIQQRVVKKAKRRVTEENSGPKAFGGFGGLVASRPSLIKAEQKGSPKIFGGGTSSAENATSPKTDSNKDSSYLQNLKSLNESVLAWIKQHVEKNPYIILSPIFKDYEKYLTTIESKKGPAKTVPLDSAVPNSKTPAAESKLVTNSFNSKTAVSTKSKTEGKSESTETNKSSPFSIGATSSSPNGAGFKFSSSNSEAPTGMFSFGKTTTTSTSEGFSFAQTTNNGTSNAPSISAYSGFSFGTTSSLASSGSSSAGFGSVGNSATTGNNDDEEYVPPKPEVKEVKENDSFYSKKCKLFYKKEEQWIDRGVGFIHLKPVSDNKTQILVRADTNLGNILLNILLAPTLPMSRQGKNNVLIVCSPNPPLKEGEKDTKPVPMLIRVKTETDADELLAKLEERKKLVS